MPKRIFAKRLAYGLATLAMCPALGSFWIRARLVGRDRALLASSQAISLLPGLLGQYLRKAFYSRALARCHPSVAIEFGTIFSKAEARVGRGVYIGPMCHLGLVDIGDDALLAAGVHVPSGPRIHVFEDPNLPIRDQTGELRTVRIGAGSWIAAGAIVLADVGEGAVVAAGSVVTQPLPDRVVAAGIPARVVRRRGQGGLNAEP